MGDVDVADAADALDDDALLAKLDMAAAAATDITQLRNVRPNAEQSAAEEVAATKRCEDFVAFKPLFDQVQTDLDTGVRSTRPFVRDLGMSKADIATGDFRGGSACLHRLAGLDTRPIWKARPPARKVPRAASRYQRAY